MKLITIDADKLNWMKITGGNLEWVNEVDLCNAIVAPSLKEAIDCSIRIDAAYEDGYKQGYEQARHDCGNQREGLWELKANGWYNCNACNKASAHRTAFCPKCGTKMKGIYND